MSWIVTDLVEKINLDEAKRRLPGTAPYEAFGFVSNPFDPDLPLTAEEESQKPFFGFKRMEEFLSSFMEKIVACYHNNSNLILCGPPMSGRTTLCKFLVSIFQNYGQKLELRPNEETMLVNAKEWESMGSTIFDGMTKWIGTQDQKFMSSENRLAILFIDDADIIWNYFSYLDDHLTSISRDPVVLIPVLTPIGYDFLMEYSEKDPTLDRLFSWSFDAGTMWMKKWSPTELSNMLRYRLELAANIDTDTSRSRAIEPFSEEIVEYIGKHSLGLPGETIDLTNSLLLRAKQLQENNKLLNKSDVEDFMMRLGITTAERVLWGAQKSREKQLDIEVPISEDEPPLIITGTRKKILEIILRKIVVLGQREILRSSLADPKEHEDTHKTIEIPQSTLTNHFANLVKGDVLSELPRRGRSARYRIRSKPIEAVLQMIMSSMVRMVM